MRRTEGLVMTLAYPATPFDTEVDVLRESLEEERATASVTRGAYLNEMLGRAEQKRTEWLADCGRDSAGVQGEQAKRARSKASAAIKARDWDIALATRDRVKARQHGLS